MSTKDEVTALRARADALEAVAAVEDEYIRELDKHRRAVEKARAEVKGRHVIVSVQTPARVNELANKLTAARVKQRQAEESLGMRTAGEPSVGGDAQASGGDR